MPKGTYSKVNLSDALEYVSPDEYERLLDTLSQRLRRHGRIAYWNLMVPRSCPPSLEGRLRSHSRLARGLWRKDRAWFYRAFNIEEVLEGAPGIIPAKTTPTFRPRIPGRGHYTDKARMERLEWARQQTGAPLSRLQVTTLNPERLTGNIENFMGGVEVPVGLAGPLLFRGGSVEGFILAPFATTEGALVASACRGATAISQSGGVEAKVLGKTMTRAPLFIFPGLDMACRFVLWIDRMRDSIRTQARRPSCHAELSRLEPFQVGNMVHLRFAYETGDAAGQNMTTACTWHACQWILGQLERRNDIQVESFLIEANLSSDKKVSYQSFLNGRGTRVTAECFIEHEVLSRVLKVTPEWMEKCYQSFLQASLGTGMVGFNINIANAIAAIFTATGQDIGCVHESSVGQLNLQASSRGLYASLLLPALIVGTVGGGTQLPTQRDLLELIGCAGPGKSSRFAEVVAGFCLALDLSTLAAIASGQFATAHERLGRNRPVRWLTSDDLSPDFLTPALARFHDEPDLSVVKVEPLIFEMGDSIITELTGRRVHKLVGLLPKRVVYQRAKKVDEQLDVMVKVKPLDDEVILMIQGMASMCGSHLAALHARHRERTGFKGCHVRELGIYEESDARLLRHIPRIYGCFRDDAREAYVIVMELLSGTELFNTAGDVSGWRREHLEVALRDLAQIHAVWLGKERELEARPWLGPIMTSGMMGEMRELWEALAVHAAEEFPVWFTRRDLRRQLGMVETVLEWWPELEAMPRTLIHNDFNPRNLTFRRMETELRLCAYDWELATLHVPQRDMAELLGFVLSPQVTADEVTHFVELHRQCLELASGRSLDPTLWRRGYGLALLDFAVNRIALYAMAHSFRSYPFMERLFRTLCRLITLEGLP
jgi:NADP-dependent 3-hydroxy-3-methylglutaryl-CoA reductase